MTKYSAVSKLWEATDPMCAKSIARTGLFPWNEQASNKLKLNARNCSHIE